MLQFYNNRNIEAKRFLTVFIIYLIDKQLIK